MKPFFLKINKQLEVEEKLSPREREKDEMVTGVYEKRVKRATKLIWIIVKGMTINCGDFLIHKEQLIHHIMLRVSI